jgi:hemin uptake protein HemP
MRWRQASALICKDYFMPTNTAPATDAPSVATPRVISSSELLMGNNEVLIDHHGAQYRLRLTRQDKLILTK